MTFLRRISQLIDPGLLLTLALTLFLITPLALHRGLSPGWDTRAHVYRADEMARSWENGLFTPRWDEAAYSGYGSPLFAFYGRITYYLTSLLELLGNISTMQAYRWLLTLCYLICSGGMYLFCKRRAGRAGALVAGLLYAYSPYLMYMEALVRGAFPELLALALAPLLLWRVDALRDKPTALNFLLVIATQVVLLNTHNLMAVTVTAICCAWVLFEGTVQFFNREASRMQASASLLALLALGLGTAAAASFWLPILLESHSVQLEHLQLSGTNDFRNHFISLRSQIERTPVFTPDELQRMHHLGVPQWSLALLGLSTAVLMYICGYRSRHPQALLGAVFFTLALLASMFLFDPVSLGLWEAFKPLQIYQFPWRFLGPMVICTAIVASLNGLWLSRLGALAGIPMALIVLATIGQVMPLQFVPERWFDEPDTTSASYYQRHSVDSLRLKAMSPGEFLPRTVQSMPPANERLLADYADGHPIDRLNRSLLPPDAEATHLHSSPEFNAWRIRSGSGFVAEIFTFYWPGWRAELDGRAVTIEAAAPHGFITVPLPAGDYTLRVYLGSTPARDAANLVLALALAAACLVAWRIRQWQPLPRPYWRVERLSQGAVAGALLGAALASVVLCHYWRINMGPL